MRLLLVLLSVTCYGQVMTELGVRRSAWFEGTVDMSRAIVQFPRTTLNPSGGCSGSQVIFSLESSELWVCSGGTWARSSSAAGAGSTSQLADFAATRTSGTVMTFSAAATASLPHQIRVGSSSIKTVTAPWAATIASGSASGSVYVYLDGSDMDLKVGHNTANTITCSGCTTVTSLTAFPASSVPLYVLTMTSGAWDVLAASMDKRAMLTGAPRFIAAGNITLTEAAGSLIIGSSGGNALDLTEFSVQHRFTASWYTNPMTGWAFTGGCTGPNSTSATANYSAGPNWTGSACRVFYPASGSLPASFHGATPKSFTLVLHGGRSNAGSANMYFGISGSSANVDNFVGVRFDNASSAYQCVIRSAGADVVATAMTATVDTSPKVWTITNSGAANSVSCAQGANAVTVVTGTIPTMSAPVLVAGGAEGAATNFSTIAAALRITGLVP